MGFAIGDPVRDSLITGRYDYSRTQCRNSLSVSVIVFIVSLGQTLSGEPHEMQSTDGRLVMSVKAAFRPSMKPCWVLGAK